MKRAFFWRCRLWAQWPSLWLLLVAATVDAAPPTIHDLSVRGLQAGGTTTLVVEGTHLTPNARLVIAGVPIASQSVQSSDKLDRLGVTVTLGTATDPTAAVVPGIYNLRVATGDGISNALPVAVDSLPQNAIGTEVSELPVALSGSLSGNQTLQANFAAKKDAPLVIEVEARRLGSLLRPVVHLYDHRRVQVAWAKGSTPLGGDARLVFTPQADGTYTVEIHDVLFQAARPGYFRLKIGSFDYADAAVPAAAQQGTTSEVALACTNFRSPTPISFQAPAIIGETAAPIPVSLKMFSGFRPAVLITETPQTVELTPADGSRQEISAPCGVTGRISQPGEEDRYRLMVKPGARLRLELRAEQIGSPLDGVLTLSAENGEKSTISDDRKDTSDPAIELAVPSDVKSMVVGIKDMLGRGGADFVYHLNVEQLDAANFTLTAADDRVQVPAGGSALLRIVANREGYDGPIQLHFDGLPIGIPVANAEIPAGESVGLCRLEATSDTGPIGSTAGVMTIHGEGAGPGGKILRPVLREASGAERRQPWLRREIGIALTANPAPFSIAWEAPSSGELLPAGATLKVPVKISRTDGGTGKVRLSLLTTQAPPAQRRRDDSSMRSAEKPRQMLRLQNDASIAADQNDAMVLLHVPAELVQGSFQLALRGELLEGEGNSVLATAFSPLRTMQATEPMRLELAGGNTPVEVRSGLGSTGNIVGKLVRSAGFDMPVRLVLDGLPQGVVSPVLDLAPSQTDFAFPLVLPHGIKPGELKDVQLVAVGKLDPSRPQDMVRSQPAKLNLQVIAGDKPNSEKPLTVFEDEQEFFDYLTEGGGAAALLEDDKFSGKAAIKVSFDEKHRLRIPGWEKKIREKPGPGEFRYLRFAWKKPGGQQACLQLIDNSQTDGKPESARYFRYHAGAGPECYGSSLSIAAGRPRQWTVVTRDLWADFGDFTLTGIGIAPVSGDAIWLDHIYLSRTQDDLELIEAKP